LIKCHHESTGEETQVANPQPDNGTPRWVTVVGIIVIVVVLLAVVMFLIGGGMGPGMHAPS
jgi:hypothetical protein